jgi:hypothetical protein
MMHLSIDAFDPHPNPPPARGRELSSFPLAGRVEQGIRTACRPLAERIALASAISSVGMGVVSFKHNRNPQ